MELIINIFYFYIALFSVYYLILSIKNLNDRKFRIQQKYNNFNNLYNNFCLIIYSHNNEATLENLINQIKTQDYPQENFSTIVILDDCSDNSEKLLLSETSIQTFCIKNQGTIGKDQAISILLEKLSASQNCNAYVFLDANRYVEKDFLYQINSSLLDAPVLSGATVLISEAPTFIEKIKLVYHKYYTNFLQKSRALMGLAAIADSDILIMKQEVVEKIGCVDFQNINTELKYSLLLSKVGFKCSFSPNIKTYINAEDFELRLPSISSRFALFKSCLPQLKTLNWAFNEQVLSLIAPSIWVLILGYSFLLKHSFNYYFIVDFSIVLLSFAALILGFCISLLSAKINSKEILFLFLYPIYSLGHIFRNFPLCRKIRKNIEQKESAQKDNEKLCVDVTVTDGKNHIPCKLELISEGGLAKVKFLFKKKKFTTSTHLRMVDAINELVAKLDEYGFKLKICHCCKHFSPNVDGSTNMIKGFCNYSFSNGPQNGELPTLLWNSCRAFEYGKTSSIIEDISLNS